MPRFCINYEKVFILDIKEVEDYDMPEFFLEIVDEFVALICGYCIMFQARFVFIDSS